MRISRLSRIVLAASGAVLVVFAVVWDKLAGIRRPVIQFWRFVRENRNAFLCIYAALMFSSFVPIFEKLSKNMANIPADIKTSGVVALSNIGVTPEHLHVVQISIWLIFLGGMGHLLELIDGRIRVGPRSLLAFSSTGVRVRKRRKRLLSRVYRVGLGPGRVIRSILYGSGCIFQTTTPTTLFLH